VVPGGCTVAVCVRSRPGAELLASWGAPDAPALGVRPVTTTDADPAGVGAATAGEASGALGSGTDDGAEATAGAGAAGAGTDAAAVTAGCGGSSKSPKVSPALSCDLSLMRAGAAPFTAATAGALAATAGAAAGATGGRAAAVGGRATLAYEGGRGGPDDAMVEGRTVVRVQSLCWWPCFNTKKGRLKRDGVYVPLPPGR
jgi:hypothetical protein